MEASVWMRRLAVSGCLVFFAAGMVDAQEITDFSLPAPKLVGSQKRELWATWYNLVPATEVEQDGVPLMDTKNRIISAPISKKEWCFGAMSGAINITRRDGTTQTYNYIDSRGPQQIDCRKYIKVKKNWITAVGKSRFTLSHNAYGDGPAKSALIPFRTIAADKKVIPLGTVLFVPSARGHKVVLPNGKTAIHDGYFFVGDKGGGAVKSNHVDVFSGPVLKNPFPTFVKHSAKHTFEAYVVADPHIRNKLVALHQKRMHPMVKVAKSSLRPAKAPLMTTKLGL